MGRWLTPIAVPQGVRQVCISLPDDPTYIAILRCFAADLCVPRSWEAWAGGVDAETAARLAAVLLQSLERIQPCG